ncbi:flavin reductase family protein [Chloroflexota bacterium]
MKIDLVNLGARDSHHLLMGAVMPRPIAWVSTVGDDGVYNLAPFSAYCVVSVKPAVVGFCVAATRDGRKKDTLRNIEYVKEFVVNVVDETLAEVMNATAAPYPANVDEFKVAGLTAVKADLVKAPMVAESSIKMECRLNQILEFGETPRTNRFIIGEVLRVHVRDELYANEEIQISKLKVIGRLGGRGEGDLYCRTSDNFEMMRPA